MRGSELRSISLLDHFTVDGAFDDECGVDLTIRDIFGSNVMNNGRMPGTIGDIFDLRALTLLFKTSNSFNEFLRHIAIHEDTFTVEQPEDKNSLILDAIREQLPSVLSERIIVASTAEIMRVAFDDKELRDDVLPAMERALALVTRPQRDVLKRNPASGTRLDSYMVDQLKHLISTTRAFIDKYNDVFLLICSEM